MHRHILIEAVSPCVDGGRYAAKGVVGEPCVVEADIFRDGHSPVRAVVRWQKKGQDRFREAPMRHFDNDRFRGQFPRDKIGLHLCTIEAWTDRFATWQAGFEKKVNAGRDVALDLEEGVELIERTALRASGSERGALQEIVARLKGP